MLIRRLKISQITTMTPTPLASRASPPTASWGPSPRSAVEKMRVLVVEDDPINRTILAKRLTLDGHTVVENTNGQEAVETLKTDRNYDCILMDIQMPILNGFEAVKRIRALETEHPELDVQPRPSSQINGRIPVFAVSASLFERQREEMLQYGMDGWILKPIDFKRLRSILGGIFDVNQHDCDVYRPGCSWEAGGWLHDRGRQT